jgi:hypothetical protein
MITANDIEREFGGGPYVLIVNGDTLLTEPALTAEQQMKLEAAWKTGAFSDELPPAENYQVRAWMIRGGMNPDAVPAIIAAVVPESVPGGINRAEALMRWDYAVRVPRNFPLVNVIGSQMGLTPEQIDAAWPDILKL